MIRNGLHRIGGRAVFAWAILGLAAVGEAGAEDDPVGSWSLSCTCPDGKARDCVIVVSRDGRDLKASYRADGVTRAARSVVYDKGILSVEVDGDFAGSRYRLTYAGKPDGNSLCGDVRWSYLRASGSFAFKGERIVEKDMAAR